MRLTQTALNKITVKTRVLIALALDLSEQTVNRYLTQNREDGPITRVTALKIIQEETGLTQDQILTESKATATA